MLFQELDVGVKDIRVFVGSDLVFVGSVDKGCGNQVFDYGFVIPVKPLPQSSTEITNPQIEVEKTESPEVPVKSEKVPQVRASMDKRQKRREANKLKQSTQNSQNHASVELTPRSRPPVSPRDRSPSPAPKFPAKSPREVASLNHRSISPSFNQDRKKTIRSISMSSQSSASSGGESQPNSRPNSGIRTPRDKAIRSDTRTLNHPVVTRNPGSDMAMVVDSLYCILKNSNKDNIFKIQHLKSTKLNMFSLLLSMFIKT